MKVIAYLDNDKLNKPDTSQTTVLCTIDSTGLSSIEQVVKNFPTVFGSDIGKLNGEYHIKLAAQITPVQHAPRHVPMAIRNHLKRTLDEMVRADIIVPVTEPTQWISSMVVAPKKNGTLRICLDPKNLKAAIQREHYPLPTIEDIATRLYGAKVFTVLDVKSGFWHVQLDEPSSYLTTFHTPFGRYRWKRMPFGISSAPEIFQRRMHELIESLTGVEVVADDFVVVVGENTSEIEAQDHDRNLEALLFRCKDRGVKLNADKIKLRLSKVPFMGHVATAEGQCADLAKVQAITEMPPPKDVKGVQRLLG